MTLRLHRGGILRRWIGARLGGGFELGDRVLRRALHVAGAGALVYYLLPDPLLRGVSNAELLLALLAGLLALEAARLLARLEVPTLRAGEEGRVASYAYFAVAIVIALLLFPRPIAAVAIAGTALVDPLLGELREWRPGVGPVRLLPWAVYVGLAVGLLRLLTAWPLAEILPLAAAAAAVAIAAELPKMRYLDDDLLMTLAPAVFLALAVAYGPG